MAGQLLPVEGEVLSGLEVLTFCLLLQPDKGGLERMWSSLQEIEAGDWIQSRTVCTWEIRSKALLYTT